MAFLEVEFPRTISFGSSGGPGFNTSIIEGESGASERVSRWSTPRRQYNVRYGIRTVADLNTVIDLYIRAAGTVHGFRYYDWLDHSTALDHVSAPTALDVEIGTGNGSNTVFQLQTRYRYGALSDVYRTIRKPISGTVVVAVGGVTTTAFTVDTTTGVITMNSAPTNGAIVTAGCEFTVPVQFGEEVDKLFAASIDNFNSGDLPDIPLIEMVGDVVSPERLNYGGGSVITAKVNFSLNFSLGKVIVYAPTNSDTNVIAYLPDPSDLEPGGEYFKVLYRPGTGTANLDIKSFDGVTTYATLNALGECSDMCVYNDGSSNKWVAFNNF